MTPVASRLLPTIFLVATGSMQSANLLVCANMRQHRGLSRMTQPLSNSGLGAGFSCHDIHPAIHLSFTFL